MQFRHFRNLGLTDPTRAMRGGTRRGPRGEVASTAALQAPLPTLPAPDFTLKRRAHPIWRSAARWHKRGNSMT